MVSASASAQTARSADSGVWRLDANETRPSRASVQTARRIRADALDWTNDPDHPLAEIDVNDPCSIVRQIVDREELRVVSHRGVWAVQLPSMGWRRAPGPSLRYHLQSRVLAHTGVLAHEEVLRAVEATLVARALAWADVVERVAFGVQRERDSEIHSHSFSVRPGERDHAETAGSLAVARNAHETGRYERQTPKTGR